ncbi:MAG: hypothetical protein WDW38_007428 [Sanguina aurantia]
MQGCRLSGVGSSVPTTILTNKDLESFVDTNDEWIVSRTGIKQRHILGKGETLGGLAVTASLKALEMAGVQAADLDLVLFATSSPDDLFGGACQVQAAIGAKRAVSFDLTAACSGFVVALVTGSQFIKTGTYKNVLVIGGDALSRVIDWRDRGTCILFGDACGAVVLTASTDGSCSMLGMDMHSDGNGQKNLHCLFSGEGNKPLLPDPESSARAAYSNLYMNGTEVFKFAVRTVPTVIEAALAKAGLTTADVDWLVMHQANQRILDAAAARLGLPPHKVVSNLASYGNTSAASIPLALDEAVRGGRVRAGDKIAMAGFGAGLTWAGAIVKWG